MTVTLTSECIRAEIAAQCYEISLHADDERLADDSTIAQIEYVLSNFPIPAKRGRIGKAKVYDFKQKDMTHITSIRE